MTIILVGSRALSIVNPGLLKRKPLDWDFICTPDSFEEWKSNNKEFVKNSEFLDISEKTKAFKGKNQIVEFELAVANSNTNELISIVKEDKQSKFGKLNNIDILIPSLDMLFALKSSHKYLKNSPHWWKTLFDYHAMKNSGASIRPEWMSWFKQREKETYAYKHPKLVGVNKSSFFDPNMGVKYVYDHDSIHEAVKHLERPAYRYFMKDGAEVACDRKKFEAAPDVIKLFSVLEESYVLALERSQIPFGNKITPKESFRIAFSKVLSSITSGWWRDWGYENALRVLPHYTDSYLDRFNEALKSGIVKPFSGDSNPYK
jgi:hypothetical protein